MYLNMPKTTPVTLLTGYLGAGKTTLLHRILMADTQTKLAVLVSDFGEVNIDSRLVIGRDEDMMLLANGCIVYTMKQNMLTSVHELLNLDEPPQHIIIEGSGVSDPSQVLLTFNRSSLRNYVEVNGILAVVDGEQITAVRGMPEKLVLDQLRVADVVVINKVDLIGDDELARVRTWVHSIATNARVYESSFCNVPIEQVFGIGSYTPQKAFYGGEHNVHVHRLESVMNHEHDDQSLVYTTWSWECEEVLQVGELKRVIDELPTGIFRAKGILYVDAFPDHKVVMHIVGKRVNFVKEARWDSDKKVTRLSLIGEKETFAGDNLEDAFENCRVSNAGRVDGGDTIFVDGKLTWVRQNL